MARSGHIYTKDKNRTLFFKITRNSNDAIESIFSEGLTKSLKHFFQNNATPPCTGLPVKVVGLSSALTAIQL